MDLETRIRELHAKGYSRTRAADLIGVPFGRFCLMIEAMGLEWAAHSIQPKDRGKHFIDGIWDTLKGHAKRMGLSRSGLRWRIQKKIKLDTKVTTPITPEDAHRFMELRRQQVPARKAAAIIGRPYNSLRLAAKRHCPEYDKVVEKAVRQRQNLAKEPQAEIQLQKAA